MIAENSISNNQKVAEVDGKDAAWWKASSDRWRDCCFEMASTQEALREQLDKFQTKLRVVEEDRGILKDLLKETREHLQDLLFALQFTDQGD